MLNKYARCGSKIDLQQIYTGSEIQRVYYNVIRIGFLFLEPPCLVSLHSPFWICLHASLTMENHVCFFSCIMFTLSIQRSIHYLLLSIPDRFSSNSNISQPCMIRSGSAVWRSCRILLDFICCLTNRGDVFVVVPWVCCNGCLFCESKSSCFFWLTWWCAELWCVNLQS